jgi:hypothetical protein
MQLDKMNPKAAMAAAPNASFLCFISNTLPEKHFGNKKKTIFFS